MGVGVEGDGVGVGGGILYGIEVEWGWKEFRNISGKFLGIYWKFLRNFREISSDMVEIS